MSKLSIPARPARVNIEPCATKARSWSGIYAMENQRNGRIYVGSSTRLERRVWEHLHKLQAGNHENPDLQTDYAQYGEEAFVFYLLEECEPTRLKTRELHWITTLRSALTGYNIRRSVIQPATRQQASNAWARVFAD